MKHAGESYTSAALGGLHCLGAPRGNKMSKNTLKMKKKKEKNTLTFKEIRQSLAEATYPFNLHFKNVSL